ncbi:hypothetical protein BDZ91DRAFT_796209 [Kalaharituber pfeilii]|nr:hypothetical protein BDZ91DRAFT_796209 [Kalaharituber pfeilii]
MPSKNNPNKPNRLTRRVKSKGHATITKPRGIEKAAGPKVVVGKGGIIRGRVVSKKKERKKQRNVEYAKMRSMELEELQRLAESGEVEMTNITFEALSKTQKKKLEKQLTDSADPPEGNNESAMQVDIE